VNYQVFARKYRPRDFDSVVGQEHITRTLKNAIEQNRLAHAYLFVGPRGVGKTSTARILAKALNCVKGPTVMPCGECDSCREIARGTSLDVLEIDGASNNGVEQVRELRENVRFAPAHGKFKIYIIDEVHMLSSAAFNALLKTLEEPPAHVKFIFATTEPQKVLPTILSRCQRFDLRRIPAALIAAHLLFIAREEKITLDERAAHAVARGAEGGLRDAESMLDQLVAFCGDKIAEEDVLSIFGFTAEQTVSRLCERILDGASSKALAILHEQSEAGKDLSRLMTDLILHLRDLLILKADPGAGDFTESARAQAARIALDRLLELIEQFAAAESRMKWAPNKKLHFEVAVIKAIQTLGQATLTEVIDALARLRTGEAPPPRQPAAAPIPVPIPIPIPLVSDDPPPPPPLPKKAAVQDDALWPAILEAVRERRKFILSWVEAGVFLGIEGNACLLGFPKTQSLALESLTRASNRVFLEDLLSEIAGRPLTLRCEVREDLLEQAPVEKKEDLPLDPVEALKNDPLIRKALEIFKGEIQSA